MNSSDKNWKQLSKTPLKLDFIRANYDCVNWKRISKYQILSEPFIEEWADYVYWDNICRYQKLSVEFIENHLNELNLWNDLRDEYDEGNWPIICEYQVLTNDFMLQYQHCIIWNIVYYHQKMSPVIVPFPNGKYWKLACMHQHMSEEFINRHWMSIFQSDIFQYQILSETFIRQHKNTSFWKQISQYQILSEDFIWEFRWSVHWATIRAYQSLSVEFIKKSENFI